MSDSNEARSLFLKLKDEREKAKNLLKSLAETLGGNEFLQPEKKIELGDCLNSILELQENLGKFDRLQNILAQNNFKKLEEEISKWEDELGKTSLREILLRLAHLDVAGQDEEKKFCEPLKKQVEVYLNREEKIPLAKWLRDGQKFIRLAKLIEDSRAGSYDDFNQITKDFGDKISFLVMRGMISIPKDVPAPKPPEPKPEPEDEKSPEELAQEFISVVGKGFSELKIDVNKFLLRESDLRIERNDKKDFTVSKLKSRLIEISIAGREIIKKLLEDLCLRNVTSVELFVERHKTSGTSAEIKKRRGISVEKILDALFRFGYISLCEWHGIKFYFVDSAERQVLAKVHGGIDLQKLDPNYPSEAQIEKYFKTPAPSDFQNFDALCNLRRYILVFALWKTATPLLSEHIRISSDYRGDWIIANYQSPRNCLVYFFNLLFTHEHCATEIFRFTYEIQKDLVSANHGKIIGAFLVTTLKYEEARSWIRLFEGLISTLIKRKGEAPIRVSILCLDENLTGTIIDSEGNSSKTWDILEKSSKSDSSDSIESTESTSEPVIDVESETIEDSIKNSVDEDSEEDSSEEEIDENLEDLKNLENLDPLQLATLALNQNHRAQAIIALSTLSEDQKFNLGFDFAGDFSKIDFDSQLISMIRKMFQRYLPEEARDSENILQVAMANFPPAKYSTRAVENSEPIDPNDFQIRASILKATEILDKLENSTADSKHAEFIRALVKSMKTRFDETVPTKFNGNRFFDECLLGGEYLELNQKGIPTSFDSKFLCRQIGKNLRALESAKSIEIAVKKSYNRALKEYDLGTLKLLAAKFSEELSGDLQDFDAKIEGISKRIGKQFEIDHTEFLGEIELSYMEGNLETVEARDSLRDFVSRAFVHFSKTQNEGLFRRIVRSRIPKRDPIQDSEPVQKNLQLDDFLHEYGNLYRICTQDPSREVEVKRALSRFESLQPPEDFSIKIEDRAMDLKARREMARDSKLDPKMKNILVIDQISAMYLQNFSDTEISKQLMKISLPFSNFQPKNSATIENLLDSGFEVSPKILGMIQNRTRFESVSSVFYRQCIESLAEAYQQGVFRPIDSPPYKLDERFLKIAMSDKKFNDAIDSAFRRYLASEKILGVFQSIALVMYREKIETVTRDQITEIFEEYALDSASIDSQLQRLLDLKIVSVDGEKYSLAVDRSLAGAESEIEESLMKLTLEDNQ